MHFFIKRLEKKSSSNQVNNPNEVTSNPQTSPAKKKMNTVTDFNKFTNWIKEKNVSSTRNPEEIEEIDLSKSLIEKAAK